MAEVNLMDEAIAAAGPIFYYVTKYITISHNNSVTRHLSLERKQYLSRNEDASPSIFRGQKLLKYWRER